MPRGIKKNTVEKKVKTTKPVKKEELLQETKATKSAEELFLDRFYLNYDHKQIDILGTFYTIRLVSKSYNGFEDGSCIGYCDFRTHQIFLNEDDIIKECYKNGEDWVVSFFNQVLRHEIVHAFFAESGLNHCSFSVDTPWPKNEEMVDWFATQGPKIFRVYQSLDIM